MAGSIYLNMSIFMYSKKFKHIKSGNIYELIRDDIINCTNVNDGQIMVLYCRENIPEKIFVREKKEFYKKFVREKIHN